MRKENLIPRARRKFKVINNSNHNLNISSGLVKRDINPLKPTWGFELTYIRTKNGLLYLCVILDLFSGKIVGLVHG